MANTPVELLSLHAPPDHQPIGPAAIARAQDLPFAALSWENFERLCHRLAQKAGDVEHAARYGRSGQAQQGIDIYARLSDGKFHCWQAKRRASFSDTNLRGAIALFLKGDWAKRSSALTITIQASIADTRLQDEIEAQTAKLKGLGIALSVLGGEQLTDALRQHEALIDDFFGRNWVTALLGPEAAARLSSRLDGVEFARVRQQLQAVYNQQFHLIDPGSFARAEDQEQRRALSIQERFLLPDILIQQRKAADEAGSDAGNATAAATGEGAASGAPPGEGRSRREEVLTRRVPFFEWARQAERLALLGEAGSGKSSLLRCLALDLLGPQSKFPELAERWGELLPLHIPFARWSREVARDGAQVGLKEIVRRSLQPLLTADLVQLVDRAVDEGRILLLIDGLDEWAEEQSARTALLSLLTFAGAHSLPVVMTARPRGFEKIGTVPSDWKTATLAPLSRDQQRSLAACWFGRFGTKIEADASLTASRTVRFMAEITRDRGMAALAEIPLLLTGLVKLSLRGQILPRNKVDAYAQLVSLLLEQHPQRRATAAGDVTARFQHARDPEQRRSALACLAFTIRSEAGDAGYPKTDARKVIKTFLQSPEGFEIAATEASAAAGEILAVNSEVQGLLVEKAPEEIGFAHASFEEFLCAEHIGNWPFERAKAFVAERAGEPRWRNVLAMLLASMTRRDEFDAAIHAIEHARRDPLAASHAEALLAEIAFSAPNRSPSTASRLRKDAIARIETGAWIAPRIDALGSALTALGDPTIGSQIEHKLRSWSLNRSGWRRGIYEELASWKAAPDLLETLWRGLHDEDRGAQRSAAQAMSQVFGGHAEIGERLHQAITRVQRLSVAAAMLEALQLGWPSIEGLNRLCEEASHSLDPALALAGIRRLTSLGNRAAALRDRVHGWTYFSSEVEFPDQGLALELLMTCWADDEALVTSALATVGHGPGGQRWDRDDATNYLLACAPENPRICTWLKFEFEGEYPLNLGPRGTSNSPVVRFARHDPKVREAMILHWLQGDNLRFWEHELLSQIAGIPDERLKAVLLEELKLKTNFDLYWITCCLLRGWGLNDSEVAASVHAALADDGRCIHLVSLLPEIVEGQGIARARLLALGERDDVRRDLLGEGLAKAGCDGRDDAAVEILLRAGKKSHGLFAPADRLFRHFSSHPKVRRLALEMLEVGDPTFASLASGFEGDPEIRTQVLDAATPLPTEMRSRIVETATADPEGPALGLILGKYGRESDAELKIRLSVGNYRHLSSMGDVSRHLPVLVAEMKAVGPDHASRRAAALAGLLALGRVDAVRDELDGKDPVRLVFGDITRATPSLHEIICEEWQQLSDCFGDTLAERIDGMRSGGGIEEVLSAAPWRSQATKETFLESFETKEQKRSIAVLRSYAQLRPNSDMLLRRCLEALQRPAGNRSDLREQAEITLLLKEQFPGQDEVSRLLEERVATHGTTMSAMLLAIYAPERLASFKTHRTAKQAGNDGQEWAAALQISAAIDTAAEFVDVLSDSVRRTYFNRYDMQQIANLAVAGRLRRDDEAAQGVAAWLDPEASIDLFVSGARYLSIAGKLGASHREIVSERLKALLTSETLPVAVYDGASKRIRSASIALFYALRGDLVLD